MSSAFEGASTGGSYTGRSLTGSHVTGSIASFRLCSVAKRFRSLPPALSFFRDTEASAFKRLISALAYSRLFSISLASEAGDSSPSSSEGVKAGG